MSFRNTCQLSDRHERFLADTFGGQISPGSGNQFRRQMDVRDHPDTAHAMAWDGKATLGKSVGVTREMWKKAREQAHGEIPALALRWYGSERLDVALDLVVLSADDFAAILEDARQFRLAEECLTAGHTTSAATGNACVRCGRPVGYEED